MALSALPILVFSFVALVSQVDSRPFLEDLVLPEGYPFERYIVRTDDGYNLGLYRIPHGRFDADAFPNTTRPVVYLQHGLLDTSAAFLMNGRAGSLAFILADAGFDVWLGNSRGNTFSDMSLQVNMDHDEFWNFSMDELAEYDLPATLQYVLDVTGVPTLVFIGHSQGTAIAHALFSTRHPITRRISIAFMMSPVAYVKHITSHFLRTLALFGTDDLVASLGYHQFMPTQDSVHKIFGPLCETTYLMCSDVASVLFGYNPENIDPAKWDTYLQYVPAGASVKLMAHWAQRVRSFNERSFQKFDYGTKCWSRIHFRSHPCNQRIYKTRRAPKYDLSKIQVPLVFFAGGHDALSDISDVLHLTEDLSPGILVNIFIELEYTHLDMIYGLDAPDRVYHKIVRMIKERQGSPETLVAVV